MHGDIPLFNLNIKELEFKTARKETTLKVQKNSKTW